MRYVLAKIDPMFCAWGFAIAGALTATVALVLARVFLSTALGPDASLGAKVGIAVGFKYSAPAFVFLFFQLDLVQGSPSL